MTSAKIIADSLSPDGVRLTTMEVTFHRFVLAELNTHRAFSRNSASSRAIPVGKQLSKVKHNRAFPIEWPREQPGMSGGSELEGDDLSDARYMFGKVWDSTIHHVEEYLEKMGEKYGDEAKSHTLHKSLINRLLEPFQWHTAIISSTEWENFFAQRCSPFAQPELRDAAYLMRKVYESETPATMTVPRLDIFSQTGWHLPYISQDDIEWALEKYPNWILALCQVSVARCARVSYLTHDGVRDPSEDIALFNKLVGATPPHWSPLEHVARPARQGEEVLGNFEGWVQLRHHDLSLHNLGDY